MACLAGAGDARAADVEREDLRTGVTLDMGRIQSGEFDFREVEGQFLSNTGVYMAQSVTIDKRLRLSVAIAQNHTLVQNHKKPKIPHSPFRHGKPDKSQYSTHLHNWRSALHIFATPLSYVASCKGNQFPGLNHKAPGHTPHQKKSRAAHLVRARP
jgi:hypothetical protein